MEPKEGFKKGKRYRVLVGVEVAGIFDRYENIPGSEIKLAVFKQELYQGGVGRTSKLTERKIDVAKITHASDPY
jgi:hypothetical protein